MKTALHSIIIMTMMTVPSAVSANSTETWLAKRSALIDSVYGSKDGALLPTKSTPDSVLTWPEAPGLQGLVWNMTTLFPITSTVFYSPITPGKRSKNAFMFHHGHSNCVGCPTTPGEPSFREFQCRPGCNSSMPSGAERHLPGYSWWDLYNVSTFFHSQGFDVFILSMRQSAGRPPPSIHHHDAAALRHRHAAECRPAYLLFVGSIERHQPRAWV